MLSAHKTGRGVVALFETAEEAEALRESVVAIDQRAQEAWLAGGGADGDGPAAGRFAQDLSFEMEPCTFYRQRGQGSAGDAAPGRQQLEA